MNQTSPNANSAMITAEAISTRAYELWESEGRPEGSDQRHWFQAEEQLRQASPRDGGSVAKAPARNSDVMPLKGTRAAAAAESSAARNSPAPTSTTTASLGSSSPKSAGKRASATPFPGKKPASAL